MVSNADPLFPALNTGYACRAIALKSRWYLFYCLAIMNYAAVVLNRGHRRRIVA